MIPLRSQVTHGMVVLDANAAPVGQVETVHEGTMLVRLQVEIRVPLDVIQDVRGDQVVLAVQSDEWLPVLQGVEEVRPPAATGPVCCACSAIAGKDKAVYYLRKRDAWFCADCWHALSLTEVERLVQEVALRGVPL